jgi:hypothetical protein
VAGSITPRPSARDRTAVWWLRGSVGCARRRWERTALRRIDRRRITGGLRRWSRRGGGRRDGLCGCAYAADDAPAASASLHAG